MDLSQNIPVSNNFKTFLSWLGVFGLGILGGPISAGILWAGLDSYIDNIDRFIPLPIYINPLYCLPYLVFVLFGLWLLSKQGIATKVSQSVFLIITTCVSTWIMYFLIIILVFRNWN